ncbi:MAG: tyrosine-type recombinase/integrase [Thermoleophilia bacterium]|nr:tyrosine-type recombinase/integrase [Thermoleophilia bacterium]
MSDQRTSVADRDTTREEESRAELLTPDEARDLITSASHRAPTGIRNRALVVMMYRAGLRPGEALTLGFDDVDLESGTIRVPARKGGVSRTIGLDEGSVAVLRRWADRRGVQGIDPSAPFFCTLSGETLKAAYVRELLPRLARRAGITKRVHPLSLRYTCASEMAAEGLPTALIEKHLGVAVSGSARRYLRTFTDDEVMAAARERVWSL